MLKTDERDLHKDCEYYPKAKAKTCAGIPNDGMCGWCPAFCTTKSEPTLVTIQTCRCKNCGELILPQFQKVCPNNCKETNPEFYGFHRYQDFKVPFNKLTAILSNGGV